MSNSPDPQAAQQPPKPPPMEPLSGELVPVRAEVGAPPPKPKLDNTESKTALSFLSAGAPLQDGLPDNPAVELAKVRKGE